MIFLLYFLNISFCSTINSRGNLQVQTTKSGYTATVDQGFHFNKEAPNKLTIDSKIIPISNLTGTELSFGPIPTKWESGRAALFICDDALTFCEPNFIDLNPTNKKVIEKSMSNENFGLLNADGFIQDDLNKALMLAKEKNQLVLIDFSARWCPGCVRYENETFHTNEFKVLTKNYIKLKIDVDRFENQTLSKEFKISAIPTLLVLNTDRQELDRLIDFQPTPTLSTFLKGLEAAPVTIIELRKKADTNTATREVLAKRLVAAGQFSESLKYFSKRGKNPPEYLYAKVKEAANQYKENPKTEKKYLLTLKEAILAEPKSTRSIVWRTNLVSLLKEPAEIAKWANEGIELADTLLANPDQLQIAIATDLVGEFTNYEDFLVSIERAELVEASSKDPSKVMEAWQVAAAVGSKHKIPVKRFGPSLRLLIVLMAAQDYKKADALSATMLKQYPHNGDLERRRLKILIAQKKFPEAIALGKIALSNSYGRNEVWVAESLAKALLLHNDLKQAKALINAYLQRTDVDWSNLQPIKKSFEDLLAQIDSKGTIK